MPLFYACLCLRLASCLCLAQKLIQVRLALCGVPFTVNELPRP